LCYVVSFTVGIDYSSRRTDQLDARQRRSATLPRQWQSGYSLESEYSSEPHRKVLHVRSLTIFLPCDEIVLSIHPSACMSVRPFSERK